MPTVLITGASRGIGLALARQYAEEGWRVLATCRHPEDAGELVAVDGDIDLYPLDVDEADSVGELAASLDGQAIDVLFNNAGVNIAKMAIGPDLDYDLWAETMATNLFGPVRVAVALRDNVAASERRTMAFVSSRMGSIEHSAGGNVIYRSSKAALNMAVACLAGEMRGAGIKAVTMHPGHVRTSMGGPGAPVTPEDSAAGMRRVVDGLTLADSGCFRNYDGTPIPW